MLAVALPVGGIDVSGGRVPLLRHRGMNREFSADGNIAIVFLAIGIAKEKVAVLLVGVE